MIARSLVIGATGYVGGALKKGLSEAKIGVTSTSRRPGMHELVTNGFDLDQLLGREHFDQIVLLPQLTSEGSDWLVDRVDGARWIVFSSAQLYSTISAPGTELALAREAAALARGATVLRPTMIFGGGGDANISRIVLAQRRLRVAIQIGNGIQLVQPLHVADLVALVIRHCQRPRSGLFDVGGDEQIPTRELLEMVKDIVGLRMPVLSVSPTLLRVASRLGFPGLRADQILRLMEDKVVVITDICDTFGWRPEPLARRMEQAVWSVIGCPMTGHRLPEESTLSKGRSQILSS